MALICKPDFAGFRVDPEIVVAQYQSGQLDKGRECEVSGIVSPESRRPGGLIVDYRPELIRIACR